MKNLKRRDKQNRKLADFPHAYRHICQAFLCKLLPQETNFHQTCEPKLDVASLRGGCNRIVSTSLLACETSFFFQTEVP